MAESCMSFMLMGATQPKSFLTTKPKQNSSNVDKYATIAIGIGAGLWLTVKWGAALALAAETFGGSIAAAAAMP